MRYRPVPARQPGRCPCVGKAVRDVVTIQHPSAEDRRALGKAARKTAPRSAHAAWARTQNRDDPIGLVEEQDRTREPDLVPVRHGRMAVSPFTFYRGAAKIMASDLARTPTSGLEVQLCGDAHLANFGIFASPERQLLFDLNDFDETLPGPFEFDVKRLATSITIAAQNNGFTMQQRTDATSRSVAAYRTAMTSFAGKRTLDIWYSKVSEHDLLQAARSGAGEAPGKRTSKRAERAVQGIESIASRARTRDSLQALTKLGEVVDGSYRIVSRPTAGVPVRDLADTVELAPDALEKAIREQFRAYRSSLEDDRRHLLERFKIVDVARKVVGVGSVGTRSYIVLLQGRDRDDPLFLQVKEATTSVLEGPVRKSRYQPGERVVRGQRLMQAASDIFLGWTGVLGDRYFYWRQLRDMKGSANIEAMKPPALTFYAEICGWALARAHARTGDPVAIAAYLGKSDTFDRAITAFAKAYADQNEQDYARFTKAISADRIRSIDGV